LQKSLHAKILLPSLDRSPYSHGGVRGRNILTNVAAHLDQKFVFTADLADFYPSIRRERVFDMFERLGCSVEVARLCTRLCTYRHRLEQGLITSPILADRLLVPVDARIGAACDRARLVYTRFVDDLAISGPFNLETSGIPALVRRIIEEHGLRCSESKDQFGQVARGDRDADSLSYRAPRRASGVSRGGRTADSRRCPPRKRRAVQRPILHQSPDPGASGFHLLGESAPSPLFV
jgi:hypothetical protein